MPHLKADPTLRPRILLVGRETDLGLLELVEMAIQPIPPFEYVSTKVMPAEFPRLGLKMFDAIVFLHATNIDLSWKTVRKILKLQAVKCPIILMYANEAMMLEAKRLLRDRKNFWTFPKPMDMEEIRTLMIRVLFLETDRRINQLEVISFKPFPPEILDLLSRNEDEIFKMSADRFEEFIAFCLDKEGWKVELSKKGPDNGIDIIACKSLPPLAPHKVIIQAKKYAKHRKVDFSVAQKLLFIKDKYRVNSAMIATTSSFTGPAIKMAKAYYWILRLKDRQDIIDWARNIGS